MLKRKASSMELPLDAPNSTPAQKKLRNEDEGWLSSMKRGAHDLFEGLRGGGKASSNHGRPSKSARKVKKSKSTRSFAGYFHKSPAIGPPASESGSSDGGYDDTPRRLEPFQKPLSVPRHDPTLMGSSASPFPHEEMEYELSEPSTSSGSLSPFQRRTGRSPDQQSSASVNKRTLLPPTATINLPKMTRNREWAAPSWRPPKALYFLDSIVQGTNEAISANEQNSKLARFLSDSTRNVQHIYERQHREGLKVKRDNQIQTEMDRAVPPADRDGLLEYHHLYNLLASPPPSTSRSERRFLIQKSNDPAAVAKRIQNKENIAAREMVIFAERQTKARKSLVSIRPPPPFLPSIDQLKAEDLALDRRVAERVQKVSVPIVKKLSNEEVEEVQGLLRDKGRINKVNKEQVAYNDIVRLRPGQWLNDEVMNLYGAMLMNQSESTSGAASIWFFNTFFYEKLTGAGYVASKLARWTKKVDIFAKDYILIPINQGNNHWICSVINMKDKRIEFYDSFGSHHARRVCKVLRGYLMAEHVDKKKTEFDFEGWTDYYDDMDTPQQTNGYDCGVFACQILRAVFEGKGPGRWEFAQQDMPYLRNKMILEIGRGHLI